MADLPNGKLLYFPVQYHRHNIAVGIEPRTKQIHGRTCRSVINFGNSFDNDRNGGRFRHDAIDIFGGFSLPIIATCRGTVVDEWRTGQGERRGGVGTTTEGDSGYYVMIEDDEGFHHYYAHLQNPPSVVPRAEIRAGQQLGHLGDTGRRARGTCQHLHYQVSRRHGGLRFFNPYGELRRLARRMGASVSRSGHVEIPFR